MPSLLGDLRRDDPVRALLDALVAGGPGAVARAGGLYGSSPALVVAAAREALAEAGAGPLVVVAPTTEAAEEVEDDLRTFAGPDAPILAFPAWEALPSSDAHPDHELVAERLEVLRRLAAGEAPGTAIVAPVAALLEPVPPPGDVAGSAIAILVGDEAPLDLLSQALERAGLARVPMVELPGEWAARGGIVDIFPVSGGGPYRIELFGDRVESIREFDPDTQRSTRALDRFEVFLGSVRDLFRGAKVHTRSLLDVLPAGARVAIVEPERVAGEATELGRRFSGSGDLLPAAGVVEGLARFPRLELAALPFPAAAAAVDLDIGSVERVNPPAPLPTESALAGDLLSRLAAGLRELAAGGTRITVYCQREGERERLAEILGGAGLDSAVAIEAGSIARGFHLRRLGRALVTTREVFRRSAAAARRALAPAPRRSRPGRPIESFLELAPGDLVVHLVHGIGRFLRVEKMTDPAGQAQEYLALEYADHTVVYVPATKIDLVQRYVGARGFAPRLSKIGTAGWQRQKEKAKEAVLDLAADLLSVQAARDVRPKPPFPPDDAWQRELEGAFPFDDTPDQARATADVKRDLESPRPMDRLLCGDVGYGKTEIAVRAAFKTAIAGKQVGILVPTTVLAEQHLETFRERVAPYPVRVECVSRFATQATQRRILAETRAGEVDILIGTHRLLSQDVGFKDLGLLIIDEEQRFGVVHKERLKRLRETIDILTLTATPIPRTLHMSLLGIKDISILETPPRGRLPIKTLIERYSPDLVRDGILRELSRGGQVFFVHNRVQTIDRVAERLEALVPEARFTVTHGQMDERLLEKRMLAFYHGEVDVLVTSAIIESGLDIPRVNTIFLNRADRFGLAELHQLRGRVGRSKHLAYAYLLLPRRRPVTEVAERRLRAIQEFSDLGAGFRIAMRDLEIRGAGNILGPQQSGHIASVGYDLYCRLLKEAVEELGRREQAPGPPGSAPGPVGAAAPAGPAADVPPPPEEGIEIELALDAYIPDRYVPDPKQKMEAYRKLATARTDADLDDATAEIQDRFGKPPRNVRAFLSLARLRVACERLGVVRVSAQDKVAILRYRGDGKALLLQLAFARAKTIAPEPGTLYVVMPAKDLPPDRVLAELLRALAPPPAATAPPTSTHPTAIRKRQEV